MKVFCNLFYFSYLQLYFYQPLQGAPMRSKLKVLVLVNHPVDGIEKNHSAHLYAADWGPDKNVIESLKKTGTVLVVEENHQCGGWGAEIISQLVMKGFDYIDTPPQRITLPDWPMPYSPSLEDAAMPSVEKIMTTVKEML